MQSNPRQLIGLVSIGFIIQGFLLVILAIVDFFQSDGPGYVLILATFASFWISSGIRNIEKEARVWGILVAIAILGITALSFYFGATGLGAIDLIIVAINLFAIFVLFSLDVIEIFEREGK